MLSKLCCFTNLSKVHPGPCTHSFVIPGPHFSRTVYIIFDLALVSPALLEVGWWGGPSSRKILLWPERLAFHPMLFLFLQGACFHTLGFRQISQGLCSVLEGYTGGFGLWNFRMGLQVVWEAWLHFLCELALRFRPDIPGGLVGSSFVPLPWFPLKTGLRRYRKDCGCSALQSNCSGLLVDLSETTIFLGLCYDSTLVLGFIPATLSSSDDEVPRDFPEFGFPSIWRNSVLAIFYNIIILSRRDQDKYNPEKRIRIALSVFSYLLTMSRSDFVKCRMLHVMGMG